MENTYNYIEIPKEAEKFTKLTDNLKLAGIQFRRTDLTDENIDHYDRLAWDDQEGDTDSFILETDLTPSQLENIIWLISGREYIQASEDEKINMVREAAGLAR